MDSRSQETWYFGLKRYVESMTSVKKIVFIIASLLAALLVVSVVIAVVAISTKDPEVAKRPEVQKIYDQTMAPVVKACGPFEVDQFSIELGKIERGLQTNDAFGGDQNIDKLREEFAAKQKVILDACAFNQKEFTY